MRFYYRPGHPKASPGGFVSQIDLDEIPMEAPKAIDAPIMVDRFYEGARASDGTDISSRAKHRAYAKEHGLSMFSDYNPDWYDRVKKKRDEETRKGRREVLERKMYEIDKP